MMRRTTSPNRAAIEMVGILNMTGRAGLGGKHPVANSIGQSVGRTLPAFKNGRELAREEQSQ